MAYFEDADEVYAVLGKLLQDITADEELGPAFQRADTIVRYQHSEPEAVITVRLQAGRPPEVIFGETDVEPEVTMTMKTDIAHRFWLGEVNVTVALARGQIKASGPVAKILKLVPLTRPVYPRYKAQLEAAGRTDLLEE